jgi:hypothetical protein
MSTQTTIRRFVTLSLGSLLLAPLAALAGGQAELSADGWKTTGGYSVFVGTPGTGKARSEVQRELAAFQRSPVGADGWKTIDGYSEYVGLQGEGKTRAEVQRELAAYRLNPVGADGWLSDGDATRFVGIPAAATPKVAARDAAASDRRVQ